MRVSKKYLKEVYTRLKELYGYLSDNKTRVRFKRDLAKDLNHSEKTVTDWLRYAGERVPGKNIREEYIEKTFYALKKELADEYQDLRKRIQAIDITLEFLENKIVELKNNRS